MEMNEQTNKQASERKKDCEGEGGKNRTITTKVVVVAATTTTKILNGPFYLIFI